MWAALRLDLDLEPETTLSQNVYLGCNQREAPIQPKTIKEKNELFHRLTTHEEQREAQQRDQSFRPITNQVLQGVQAWNYDMIGHAEQCVQRWCELTNRDISSQSKLSHQPSMTIFSHHKTLWNQDNWPQLQQRLSLNAYTLRALGDQISFSR